MWCGAVRVRLAARALTLVRAGRLFRSSCGILTLKLGDDGEGESARSLALPYGCAQGGVGRASRDGELPFPVLERVIRDYQEPEKACDRDQAWSVLESLTSRGAGRAAQVDKIMLIHKALEETKDELVCARGDASA